MPLLDVSHGKIRCECGKEIRLIIVEGPLPHTYICPKCKATYVISDGKER